ncbi:MAG: hypothetical protein ACTSRK_08220 [Promethearchaeota archaeon]
MEQEKKENIKWLGFTLAIVGAVIGIVLHTQLFLIWYDFLIAEQIRQFPLTTNWIVITYMLPVFTDFGLLAGSLYAVSAFGFLTKKNWAYAVATVANVLALQFSFWPMIPPLDLGLIPWYALIFLPNALIFFALHLFVGKRPGRRVIAALISGMVAVTAWINGTASLNMTLMNKPGRDFLIMANRLHWVIALSFTVVTVGLLLFPKKQWIPMLGLGAGILEITLGTPMGITWSIIKDEFSMYLAAPIFSAILILVFIIPPLYNQIVRPERDTIGGKSWMI